MLSTLKSAYSQSANIPTPPLTEKNLPSQAGRVHIVTGGYAGVGHELSRMLYEAGGTVYVAGRSREKGEKAINAIRGANEKEKAVAPQASMGKIEFLEVDLADLSSIKKSVQEFESKESRLDVLTNNAGVMVPPAGSKTAQNHELQVGTNCLGPFLFTTLLKPILLKTAASSPPGSVRVTWAGSLAVDLMSPKPGGIRFDANGAPKVLGRQGDYGQSKAGNYLIANEMARRWGTDGKVLHICWNPGNLKTELQRHAAGASLMNWMLYPATYGAYTELYSACSEDLTMGDGGCFIAPWGRKMPVRPDIQSAVKEGGSGVAEKFWEYCERETNGFT